MGMRHCARAAGITFVVLSAGLAPVAQDAPEVRCGVEMRNVALHVADGQ